MTIETDPIVYQEGTLAASLASIPSAQISPNETLSKTQQSSVAIAKLPEASKTPQATAVAPTQAPSKFFTEGEKVPGVLICHINGVAVPYSSARKHGDYLAQMSSNVRVECIYNPTSGYRLVDIIKAVFINYVWGISPGMSKLLVDTWTEFHEANKNNPDAKLLQICHSQGALHVFNALTILPKEIRNRIIVVAIAPAIIVPQGLCFQSYNYRSTDDGVPTYAYRLYNQEFLKRLIELPPHPDAKKFDHAFQSPTYQNVLQTHIQEYLDKYRPKS